MRTITLKNALDFHDIEGHVGSLLLHWKKILEGKKHIVYGIVVIISAVIISAVIICTVLSKSVMHMNTARFSIEDQMNHPAMLQLRYAYQGTAFLDNSRSFK